MWVVFTIPLLTLPGALEIFLKVDGIEGDSVDDVHKGEIDVLSFEWGATNSGSMHSGGGGGIGQTLVEDLTIIKRIDKASANLLYSLCTGQHISEAVLYLRRPLYDKAGSKQDFLVLRLSQVLVTGYSIGGAKGELTDGQESVRLNFGKVEYSYTPESGGSIDRWWDAESNKGG